MTVYKIMTWQNNTISSLGHSVPKRCHPSAVSTTSSTLPWVSLSLTDIAGKHSSICRRISILFRHQSRQATAPNTTTSMTDVLCYRTAVITTTLVVDESLGIYSTDEVCGVPGPFYQNFPSLVTPRRTDSTRHVLPFGTTTFWSSDS